MTTETSEATTSGSGRKRRSETTGYQVMLRKTTDGKGAEQPWFDVAWLIVPSGTRRVTLREKVKAEVDLGLEPGETAELRFIPAEHTQAEPVSMEQPPPQLRIGT